MSLLKTAGVPPLKLLRCIHDKRLLLRSITPPTVLPARLNQSTYRRPGQPEDDTPIWKKYHFNYSIGVERIKKHIGLLKKEFSDLFIGPEGKPLTEHILEQNRVVWEFRGPESLQQWIVSSDEVIGGQSKVHLKLGKNNTCFLYGTLCTTLPKDGETTYSGYCAMRSRQPLKSFDRKKHHDWTNFNTLHLRIRGDGRPWMVTMATEMYYSHNQDDLYCYFIYPRGGPYWEDIKIPFSKFLLTYRGKVQDNQSPVSLDKVNTIGLTLGDRLDGPFQLEIDFIGVCIDYAHTEEFAYEMYKRNPEV